MAMINISDFVESWIGKGDEKTGHTKILDGSVPESTRCRISGKTSFV